MSQSLSSPFEVDFRWLGRIEYSAALKIQNELVQARRAGDIGDTILLLEHEPVYTIGRTRDHTSLNESVSLTYPLIETNRGGQATYHGPGQLVGYPILDLSHYGRDLHYYLRLLEKALIAACQRHGIVARRVEELTGVWVNDAKIASIGVGVRHWISMHGFALNVSGDLAPFTSIIPCGLNDVTMTSIERETGEAIDVETFAESLQAPLRATLKNAYTL